MTRSGRSMPKASLVNVAWADISTKRPQQWISNDSR